MSATGLGGNIFVSFILTALIEIPSYIFCILVMDHWGRKPIFVSSLLLTGIAAIPAAFMDDGVGKTILALAGKFKKSSQYVCFCFSFCPQRAGDTTSNGFTVIKK